MLRYTKNDLMRINLGSEMTLDYRTGTSAESDSIHTA